MRNDTPKLPKIGCPDTVRFSESKSRGARDLQMCGRLRDGVPEVGCGKLFAPELLGPATAGPGLIRWDPRKRGPVGWRIGVPDPKAMVIPDAEVKCCKACGGNVAPPQDPPIWKSAKAAWAETKASDPWFALCGKRGGK